MLFRSAVAQKEVEFTTAQQAVYDDPNVDMLIVRSYPGRDAPVWGEHLIAATQTSDKPILISLTGTVAESTAWLPQVEATGVPCFEAPSRLVYAASAWVEFEERRSRLGDRARMSRPCPKQALPASGDGWDEALGKSLLKQYGIVTPSSVFVPMGHERDLNASALRFPVVLKVVSADIPHKTEAGGVKAGIVNAAELSVALQAMMVNVRERRPAARIRGWLVEEMASGMELMVGALNNLSFGPAVLVGMGGVQAEVLQDVVRAYAPVDRGQARSMILRLKGASLLTGFRGQPACDIDAAADAISRLSWLVADHADTLAEVEVNPLMVGLSSAVAVYPVTAEPPSEAGELHVTAMVTLPARAEGDCGAEGTMGSSARADDPEEITPDTTSSARMTRIPSRRLVRTCTTAPPSKVPSGMLGPLAPSWRGVNSYRHASRNC